MFTIVGILSVVKNNQFIFINYTLHTSHVFFKISSKTFKKKLKFKGSFTQIT